jgi:putative membrane protein
MNTSSKRIPFRCGAILVAATLFSALSAAEESSALPNSPTLTTRASGSELSHSDRSFIEKAVKAGAKEIQISQVVEGRVTDPQVKALAQMMVADHMAANTELLSLAARKGLTLPQDDLKASEKWSKKSKDLDEDYVKEMKADHEEAVKLFEKGAKSDDAEIAAFAQKTLPALQHHLSMVKELKKTVN